MDSKHAAYAFGITLALASIAAHAQTTSGPAATPRVDARQANQEQRIDHGVASGQLTAHETKRLDKEQNAIDNAENRAKSDGTVSRAERHHLHRMQNVASRDIHHQKHDAQVCR